MVAVEEAENPIFAEVKHHPSGKWGGMDLFPLIQLDFGVQSCCAVDES